MKSFPDVFKKQLLSPVVTGVICAASAMLLYALTVAPTFSWGDSADLALRLVYSGDPTFVGSHRDYVLWRLLGQAVEWLPIQDAGLRANLYTAFWGAITVGAVATAVQEISRSMTAAFAAAGSLAVAHSFWLLSVIAEVYTFNAALVFLTFAFVTVWWESARPRWMWLAAFFAGLSLVHHATGLILLVSVLPLLALRGKRLGSLNLLVCFSIFFMISAPYWLSLLPRLGSGMSVLSALGLKMTENAFFEVSMPREALKFFAYLAFNFIGFGLALGCIGLFVVAKYRIWAALPPLIWAAAFICAGITSSIPDKFNVYVLVYPSFAILIGLGTAWIVMIYSLRTGVSVAIVVLTFAMPPIGYSAVIRLSTALNIDLVGARSAPLRNNASYFLWPPKNGDYGPRNFAERALLDMPKQAILIADYTLWRPLYFVQAVESLRTDVEVVFVERLFSKGVANWINEQPCDRKVFLATTDPPNYYQLEEILDRFQVSQFKSVYEVERECDARYQAL